MNKGFTIWLTGLSGAGKSTLAIEIEKFIKEQGKPVQVLDGDIIRNEVGNLFGYTREDRQKMGRVVRTIAKLLNDNGINVIVAAIAAYEEMRVANRDKIDNYIEVYVNCSIDTCIERDVKGLYKKALRGEAKHVVGIDDVYEVPEHFDIEVKTDIETVEESGKRIKDFILKHYIRNEITT
ncbi:adenylyl-sulfate kinase [Desulfuribacillus alkaliarsenatis]|nr:adenylyl-sulfate kinase [Desulfuribacillus alkaliarsenatis]